VILRGALALAAALSSGCFTLSTTDVLVRDRKAVELQKEDGASVLPEGAVAATFDRGEYWDLLSREPYTIHAERDDQDEITLRCDACDRDVELLHPNGWTLPTTSWSVDATRAGVTADYDVCMRSSGRHCGIHARPRLSIQIADVVEVRRRVEPVRIWGWMLLAGSVIGMAMTSAFLAAPHFGSFEDRAPWAAMALVPTLTWGGIGLWEVLSPAREQVWRPGE
jgi:hypothetical protein